MVRIGMKHAPVAKASGAWSISCRYQGVPSGASPAKTTTGALPRAAMVSAVMIWV
jgi:hypothetical protein